MSYSNPLIGPCLLRIEVFLPLTKKVVFPTLSSYIFFTSTTDIVTTMASYMYYPNYAAPQLQPFHGHSQSMGAPPVGNYGYYQTAQPMQPYYQPQPHRSFHNHSSSYPMVMPPPGMGYLAPPAPSHHMPLPPVQPQLQPPVQQHPPPAQNPESQVNGGVREVLDYDLKLMSEFVVKNAYLVFDNDDAINVESSSVVDVFTKGVSSVLNATRLPSVTIFMALDFLCKYISKLPAGVEAVGGDSVNVIYQNLMIALVLANKFNDDKTFTNKSWSHATGMELSVINQFERDWLAVFEWRLFDDNFVLFDEYSNSFKQYCQEKSSPVHQYNAPSLPPSASCVSGLSPVQQNCSGFQTPMQAPPMVYSSPCFTEERSTTSNSFYQPTFASPISNESPMTKQGMNGYSYNYYSAPQPAPALAPMSSNLLWNNRVDEFYPQSQFAPPNKAYYCYSN